MDNSLLSARIDDLKYLCEKTNSPKFLGFLTAEQVAVAVKRFKSCERYQLFGGYENAERVLIGILPEWCDETTFPITVITFTYRECDSLTHRDFLGALMALGIARETVGDILVSSGRAVVFVLSDIEKFVLTQIEKIGSVGVTVTKGFSEPLPQGSKKQSFTVTVASMRLDCVVSALCNISRKEATQKIDDGYVSVNSVAASKATVTVLSQSKIVVRQKGKYQITSCDEHSKKGRVILKYDKYV